MPLAGPAPWLEKCCLAPWNGFCAIVKTGTIKWPYCVALCGLSALFRCPRAHTMQSALSELGKAQSNFPSSSSLMVLPLKAWFPNPTSFCFIFTCGDHCVPWEWPQCSLRSPLSHVAHFLKAISKGLEMSAYQLFGFSLCLESSVELDGQALQSREGFDPWVWMGSWGQPCGLFMI